MLHVAMSRRMSNHLTHNGNFISIPGGEHLPAFVQCASQIKMAKLMDQQKMPENPPAAFHLALSAPLRRRRPRCCWLFFGQYLPGICRFVATSMPSASC